MTNHEVFLSRTGYQKLFEEHEYRKKIKRNELSKAIGEALEQGDLNENAGYHAAKEEQAKNEKRINEIGAMLASVRIIEDKDINTDGVYLGTIVQLKNLDSGEEEQYKILSGVEADPIKGEISHESPVGKMLLGHKVNDEVEISIPKGKIRYKIIKISK